MLRIGIILTIIVIIAALVRIIGLDRNPYGFFCDEAVNGIDAYSLITRGTDHYGNPPGVFFQALGDYKGFVGIVSVIPFIKLFGLNEKSVRLASACYGILTVIIIYFLTKEITGKPYLGLIAALILALSPWNIHITRMGFEFSSMVFFISCGLYLFLIALKNSKLFLLAFFIFGISLYTYAPARLYIPILVFGLCLIFCQRIFTTSHRIVFVASLLLFLIVAFPYLSSLLSGLAFSRFQQISVFTMPTTSMGKIIHILNAYLNFFSPIFLFFRGDSGFPGQNVTRHSVSGMGELYVFQIPFIILGIIYLITKSNPKLLVVLLLLLVYPLCGAFTIDVKPFATRGALGIIPFTLLTVLGFHAFADFFISKSKQIIIDAYIVIIVIIITSFGLYLPKLISYPLYSSGYWGYQSGPREMIAYYVNHASEYDHFYMDGRFNAPEIFLDFYIPDEKIRQTASIGSPNDTIDYNRTLFGVNADEFNRLKDKNLYSIQKIIYYPNGEKAFYMIYRI